MTLIRKNVVLTEANAKMLTELIATGQFVSEAEVIRHALRLAHKRQFPYYKQIAEAKDEDYHAREELKKMPLEQYVKTVLQGDMKMNPGFVHLIHKNNDLITADIPVNIVKNFASRNEVWESVEKPLED